MLDGQGAAEVLKECTRVDECAANYVLNVREA